MHDDSKQPVPADLTEPTFEQVRNQPEIYLKLASPSIKAEVVSGNVAKYFQHLPERNQVFLCKQNPGKYLLHARLDIRGSLIVDRLMTAAAKEPKSFAPEHADGLTRQSPSSSMESKVSAASSEVSAARSAADSLSSDPTGLVELDNLANMPSHHDRGSFSSGFESDEWSDNDSGMDELNALICTTEPRLEEHVKMLERECDVLRNSLRGETNPQANNLQRFTVFSGGLKKRLEVKEEKISALESCLQRSRSTSVLAPTKQEWADLNRGSRGGRTGRLLRELGIKPSSDPEQDSDDAMQPF